MKGIALADYTVSEKPFYVDVNGETELFRQCYRERIPVMLKGPTGCGKSRFIERMVWELSQEKGTHLPLITVPCHEDLTADDLIGRYLLDKSFQEGPALVAVRHGGILYLDEVVEARTDTTVVIHPLTDHRRTLNAEKQGLVYRAHENFLLVVSYNPGYQTRAKDLKPSTKQRFAALQFGYPPADLEQHIIQEEAGVDKEKAEGLVRIGHHTRNLKEKGIPEGASTRLLIYAGRLIANGVDARTACENAVINPLTDDSDLYREAYEGLTDILDIYFAK